MEFTMIDSLEIWFHYFRVPASRFRLQYKMKGIKISSNLFWNSFTNLGTIQNVFEGVEESVEAVIRQKLQDCGDE